MPEQDFTEPPPPQEQAEKTFRQLVLDYRGTFNGERGQHVLADLHRRFGFHRPSAVRGMRSEELWLHEGMKQPFYHIEFMRNWTAPKPKHEPRESPGSSP
jgi:hypothetical protein